MSQIELLKEQRQVRVMSPLEQQMHEDLLWAMKNPGLEKLYRGQLVVVRNKEVIAHGTDEHELLQQASSAGHPTEELVVVEYPDPFSDLPSQGFC